ncbi:MAG TPA: DUF2085 domain-containing protein [Aggregatilinea sp.]|uniref:DUF2085 domain-containing protein n=1 Tax=Aggregatilinea sp. TaxID=2806333 RepID=UPI002CC07B82|nr:DUF2085 domain-containing protein [Aggregatilinea sp.]HML23341.1 DUF2085 domain-containing protein [Aggregatilinea sp.]
MTAAPDTSPHGERVALHNYSRRTRRIVLIAAAAIFAAWLLGTPGGLWGKADAVGYAICHRIPARSFHLHGHPLPLCARCTGIYMGVMAGAIVYGLSGRLRSGRLPPIRVLVVLGLFGLAIAADGINSYLSLFGFYSPVYEPNNTLRLITGMYAGLTMITIVLPVFNLSAWRRPDASAPLNGLKELVALCLIGAVMIAGVLLEVPVLLAAFALLSVVGVVLMFMLIGGILFLALTRREAAAVRRRNLIVPALAGLAFAFIVIGGIDMLRYALTSTWDGFTFIE